MTLLFMDGFEAEDLTLKYTYGSTPSYVTTTRDSYGKAVKFPSYAGVPPLRSVTASAKIIAGCAYRLDALGVDRYVFIFRGDTGTTSHVSINVGSGGVITANRGASLIASGSGSVTAGTWNYIEAAVTIADSGGTVEVKLNGTTVINFTGDTKNGGTSTNIDAVLIGPQNYAGCSVDDLYVCNALGSVNNTFLGDVRVRTVSPAGAGATTNLTPTGTGNNWENVDELPYSTTDYNSSSTVGHRDTYAMADLSGSFSAVHGIQTNMIAKKGSGNPDLRSVVRQSSTNYFDSSQTIATTVGWRGAVRETDPATSAAWTVSGVNSIEAGVELT